MESASARACGSMRGGWRGRGRSLRAEAGGAEVVGEGLALLREGVADEAEERVGSTPRISKRGAKRQRKTVEWTCGGGEKALRGQGEERFDGAVESAR